MAWPRGRAQVGSDVRLGILFRWDGAGTDPHEVREVEVVGPDGVTVLATLSEFEHEAGSGEYYVVAPGTVLTEVGRYLDRWRYTWVEGEGEQVAEQDFYVQETAALEHYGADVEVGVGYLKGLPPLAETGQDGLTQGDLDAGMCAADVMIESIFGTEYDISGWRAEPPALVSMLWELLACAKVLEFAESRGTGEQGNSGARRLVRSARELVDKIVHGWPERLHLRDGAGNVIRARKNGAGTVARVAGATSDLF